MDKWILQRTLTCIMFVWPLISFKHGVCVCVCVCVWYTCLRYTYTDYVINGGSIEAVSNYFAKLLWPFFTRKHVTK